MSLDRSMARTLKLTLRKNERILPSEKKSHVGIYALSVLYSFFFGFLEKHQKRQIEMKTSEHSYADHFDSKYLGADTPVRVRQ